MSNNVIFAYAHVYYSPMFIVLSVDVVLLLIMVTLKVLSHHSISSTVSFLTVKL